MVEIKVVGIGSEDMHLSTVITNCPMKYVDFKSNYFKETVRRFFIRLHFDLEFLLQEMYFKIHVIMERRIGLALLDPAVPLCPPLEERKNISAISLSRAIKSFRKFNSYLSAYPRVQLRMQPLQLQPDALQLAKDLAHDDPARDVGHGPQTLETQLPVEHA